MILLPLAIVLALHAPASTTTTEPSALELHWTAPAACPDRAALLATIDATLGEVPDAERRPVTVHGSVTPHGSDGFVLHLELDDGHAGTRELRGPSCEELTDAAALVIAMTIDPRLLELLQSQPSEIPELVAPDDAALAEPHRDPAEPEANEPSPNDRESTPAEPEPTTASAPPSSAQPSTSTPPDRPPLHALARFTAGLGGGPLPAPTAVLSLAVGLGTRLFRAELTASYWTPRTGTSPINPTIGVHTQLWSVGANACAEPRLRTLTVPLCTGFLAGLVHAHGTGELQPRSVTSRWVALALEPGLTWWFHRRVGLTARAHGHVTLARPELRSNPSGTVFLGRPIGGSLLAGLELRLP